MGLDIIFPKRIFVMNFDLSYTTNGSNNSFSIVHDDISISVWPIELKKFFYSMVSYANSDCLDDVSHKLWSTSAYRILCAKPSYTL